MIPQNELRVGNWVVGSHSETPIKVGHHTVTGFDLYGQRYNNFNPIPLTQEILEKCGFDNISFNSKFKLWTIGAPEIPGVHVQMDKSVCYAFPKSAIILNLIKDDWHFIYGKEHLCTSAKINHVHQLQNLYFALTGTELEINLTE